MELALTPPQDFLFLETIKHNFSMLSVAWNDFVALQSRKKEAAQKLAIFFQSISNISSLFPEIYAIIATGGYIPVAFQYEVALTWIIRDVHFHISVLKHRAERQKNLNGKQFKQLKWEIRAFEIASLKFDTTLAQKIQFPLDIAVSLNWIGSNILYAPLRIFIDDDDTGKHVSCFEIPQIYGFGETAGEAVHMLTREILSMHTDLCEDTSVSREYEALKCFLDLVLTHEKY